MIKSTKEDDGLILEILTQSFDKELLFNYGLVPGGNRVKRIREALTYCIEFTRIFGDIYLSDNRKACVLIKYPYMQKYNLRLFRLDFKALTWSFDIKALLRFLKIEKVVEAKWPKEEFSYIWFIGVSPGAGHQGIGTNLLRETLALADQEKIPVCLETSTLQLVSWYERFGFKVYDQADFGFTEYFMRRPISGTEP